MCYAKPGPRCSAHTRQALTEAKKSGNPTAIKDAEREWLLSPAGIKHLHERGVAGDDEAAEAAIAAQELRNLQLAAYRKETARASSTSPTSPLVADTRNPRVVLADPHTREADLIHLASKGWAYEALLHPNATPAVAEAVAELNPKAAANSPLTPPRVLAALVKRQGEMSDDTLVSLASNPNTPASALAVLADGPRVLREGELVPLPLLVARNHSADEQTLGLLTQHEDERVRRAVVWNRSTTPELMTVLMRDDSAVIREQVAQATLTPAVAAHLAGDESAAVRYEACRNRITPLDAVWDGMKEREDADWFRYRLSTASEDEARGWRERVAPELAEFPTDLFLSVVIEAKFSPVTASVS